MLKFLVCVFTACVGSIILGLIVFLILNLVCYITEKLGNLIFGKDKNE